MHIKINYTMHVILNVFRSIKSSRRSFFSERFYKAMVLLFVFSSPVLILNSKNSSSTGINNNSYLTETYVLDDTIETVVIDSAPFRGRNNDNMIYTEVKPFDVIEILNGDLIIENNYDYSTANAGINLTVYGKDIPETTYFNRKVGGFIDTGEFKIKIISFEKTDGVYKAKISITSPTRNLGNFSFKSEKEKKHKSKKKKK